jgi:hypothetical protein
MDSDMKDTIAATNRCFHALNKKGISKSTRRLWNLDTHEENGIHSDDLGKEDFKEILRMKM